MIALKAKGPAATAIAPDHGSKHSPRGNEMNEATNNTADADAPDPLLEAIRLYRRGLAEFNFRTFDTDDDKWDELADETYSPHLKVLSDWDEAATTAKAAKEALRITLVDDGGIMGCDDAVKAMIKAAYGYLKEVA